MDGTNQTDTSEANWSYTPGDAVSPNGAVTPAVAPVSATSPQPEVAVEQPGISWTASEFIAHHKAGGWYALLTLGAVVGSAVVYLVTKDIVSSVVILIAALGFGVVASRKPRELSYKIDDFGLSIGMKHFTYDMFRSFSVAQEGAFSSIIFVPLKRFAPLTIIYYDPADEDAIVNTLSAYLPMEQRGHDVIDRLMWRIRF